MNGRWSHSNKTHTTTVYILSCKYKGFNQGVHFLFLFLGVEENKTKSYWSLWRDHLLKTTGALQQSFFDIIK